MKIQLQIFLALTLASQSSGFAPSPGYPNKATMELSMGRSNDENEVLGYLGKSAMSFAAASALVFSTMTTVLPVPPAVAAKPPSPPVEMDAKAAKKAKADGAKAAAAAEKEALAKMGKQEKEKYLAKKSLDFSESSLKEYSKIVAEAKGFESKAGKTLNAQEKSVAKAKAAYEAASDKLSLAKKQKMPSSAIKELSEIQCKCCRARGKL